jgi:hypothetical protein
MAPASVIPICSIHDRSEEVKNTLRFSLKGGQVFQGEYHTTPAQTIVGNIWQAGSDPGVILLGVSFSTDKQVTAENPHRQTGQCLIFRN